MRTESLIKPFVKWVGGKTQLLEDIKRALPDNFASRENITYVEPFVGGGAVLFWILRSYQNITRAVINDINPELICTYQVIKEDVGTLIETLKRYQEEYTPLDISRRKMYFLEKRALFNTKATVGAETASLFIFLNRTCFNGLYRVNSKGEFNVPFGKYAHPKICDADTLLADSKLLQKVDIFCGDFANMEAYAGQNSLYYLDPPYRPLTITSAFTSYSNDGFNDNEQRRLKAFCDRITEQGSMFVASNSDPENINEGDNLFDLLYNKFVIKRVSAARMINSKSDGRGRISEIMISNI